jgi:hypothetical protein
VVGICRLEGFSSWRTGGSPPFWARVGFGKRRSWRWRYLRRRRPGLRKKKTQINAPMATSTRVPVMMKKSTHAGVIWRMMGIGSSIMSK